MCVCVRVHIYIYIYIYSNSLVTLKTNIEIDLTTLEIQCKFNILVPNSLTERIPYAYIRIHGTVVTRYI